VSTRAHGSVQRSQTSRNICPLCGSSRRLRFRGAVIGHQLLMGCVERAFVQPDASWRGCTRFEQLRSQKCTRGNAVVLHCHSETSARNRLSYGQDRDGYVAERAFWNAVPVRAEEKTKCTDIYIYIYHRVQWLGISESCTTMT
jgi:hypothetical protein